MPTMIDEKYINEALDEDIEVDFEGDGKKTIERLEGEVPSPINPPPGCRFAARCKYATDICRQQQPQLVELEPDHFVACHHCK